MANKTIGQLPAATTAANAKFAIEQSGVTKYLDLNLIGGAASYVLPGVSGGSLRTDGDRWRDGLISVKDLGAVGDGITDDGPILYSAINTYGGVYIPSGTYKIASYSTIYTGTKPIRLVLAPDAELFISSSITALTFNGSSVLNTTLASNALKGATNITVVSTVDVQIGDICSITTSVNGLATGGTIYKSHTALVIGVSGSTVYLSHPLRFAFDTTDTGLVINFYRNSYPVEIIGGSFNVEGTATGKGALSFFALKNPLIFGTRFRQSSSTPNAYYVTWNTCIGGCTFDLVFNSGLFGMNVLKSVNAHFNYTYSVGTKDPHFFFNWCSDCYVSHGVFIGENDKNCSGIGNYAAFDIHYSNCTSYDTGGGVASMPGIGGSIRNCFIKTVGSGTPSEIKFQIRSLVDMTAYDDARFVISDSTFDTTANTAIYYGGAVEIRNSSFGGALNIGFDAPNGSNPIKNVSISNVSCNGGYSKAIALTSDFFQNDAIYEDNVYKVYLVKNPQGRFVSYNSHRLNSTGTIATNISTDPVTLPLRVFYNWRYITGEVFFIRLRVWATLSHADTGVFDFEEKVFHLRVIDTGGQLATTPAYDDAATGQTNESLSIAIANLTNYGSGSADTHYFQVDLTLSHGRTTPNLTVCYDIEVTRQGA